MKKKLLALTSVLFLFLTLAFSASAINISEFKSKSTFTPVTYSSHKATSEVTLYGNADYLCMKAYSSTDKKDLFCIEIYSDSKRTKQILSYSNTFKKGTTYEDILFDLTELKSKTYYATAYVMKESSFIAYGYNIKKDPDTVKNFKIVVKRDGTSIKNMKCIMYGYENTFYGPAIYWYSVPGATKYYVYKYTDGKYKKIATVNANGEDFSFYVDETLKSKNVTRYYKIKAVKGSSTTPASDKLKVITLKAPTVKAQVADSGNGINVTWSKPKSGCSYIVFRAANDGDWKELATTTSTKYYDTSVKSGNAYYYTVVAQSSNAVSGYDPYGAGCYFIGKPSVNKLSAEDGNIAIGWKAVSKADSYKVYRRAHTEKDWTFIGETKTTTFTDTAAEKNVPYYYAVRAAKDGNLSAYGTRILPVAIFDTPVLNEIEVNEKGQPIISWTAEEGLLYEIYRKEPGGNWNYVGDSKSDSFVDENKIFANGKKYSYTVKAGVLVRIEDEWDPYNEFIGGDYDETGKEFTYYAPIASLSAAGTDSGIELDWSSVDNIDGYNIYRKDLDGEFELIATSDRVLYEDKNVSAGNEYTYKVTYNVAGTEMTDCAAETTVKISTDTVKLSDEIKVFNKYYGNWQVKLQEYDKDNSYRVFIRMPEGWILYTAQKTSNGTIVIGGDQAKEKNEFAIAVVKKDGTVTLPPETGFVLDPFEFKVTFEIDQDKLAANFSFFANEEIEKYNIYSETGEFLVSVDGKETAAVLADLEAPKYYSFVVGAVKDGTEVKVKTDMDYLYKTPEIKNIKIVTDGVRVEWDSRGLGSVYQIYRKTSPDAVWTKIGDAQATIAYVDKTAKDGTTYYYAVITGDEDTGKFSAFPEEGTKFAYIKSTTVSKVEYGKNYVKLTWKKSAVADCYQIYRKEGSGAWKLLRTTDDGDEVTYTDKTAKVGTKYTYSIRVCKGGERSEGAKKTVTFVAAPTNLKVSKGGTFAKLSFKASKGATRYYIYRKASGGSWKLIDKIYETSYEDYGVRSGKYYYCVKAYNSGGLSVATDTVSVKF